MARPCTGINSKTKQPKQYTSKLVFVWPDTYKPTVYNKKHVFIFS